MRRPIIIVLVLGLAIAACGGGASTVTTTAPIDGSAPVAVVRQTGGCMMMGPNCPTYVVSRDGSVAVLRSPDGDLESIDAASAELTASIPQETVDALVTAIENADFETLRAELDPGTCQGCVDGIDTEVLFYTESGTEALSSIDFAFDPAQPVFGALDDLVATIAANVTLPVEQR